MPDTPWTIRYEANNLDPEHIQSIVSSAGFFNEEEIIFAVELVNDKLKKWAQSAYHFLFLEQDGQLLAYACYGKIDGTQNSYDLYWIATHQDTRGKGAWTFLIQETEKQIAQYGPCNIYAETAGKELYAHTRNFYLKNWYIAEAVIKDFYAPGDDKIIFSKKIS